MNEWLAFGIVAVLCGLLAALAAGWPNPASDPLSKLTGTFEVTLIGVLAIQSAGEPERAPRVEAPARELADDMKALARKQSP